MTTYKEIRGTNIETVSSDPSNTVEGQVWYNTTSDSLKAFGKLAAGTWSTGHQLNSGRRSLASSGTQTAALVFGGAIPPVTGATESYNGSAWTEVNNLNTARQYLGGDGTQTSTLAFSGEGPPITAVTELWNGTNWTEVNDLNTARNRVMAAGANNTAALCFGGAGAPGNSALTELWNGSNWTEVNDLGAVRYSAGSAGTATAALTFGGAPPGNPFVVNTELWNGTNWTEVNNLSTGRIYLGGCGISTNALAFGGATNPNPTDTKATEAWNGTSPGVQTEAWNGTNWSNESDLIFAISGQTGLGVGTAALSVSGGKGGGPFTANTEEWNGAGSPTTFIFENSPD